MSALGANEIKDDRTCTKGQGGEHVSRPPAAHIKRPDGVEGDVVGKGTNDADKGISDPKRLPTGW